MIADLHAHYPIHLLPEDRPSTFQQMARRQTARRRDRLRAWIVGLLGRFSNYESFESGPRVTVPSLSEGEVGVVLSVLYSPFDEMDLEQPYGAAPQESYLGALSRQLELVDQDIAAKHADTATVARNAGELDQALVDGKIAFVHCVEGGFHLGASPEAVERAVEQLARRGVAYVTLAHLFWRRVATNAPALPFLPDPVYRLLFPQPSEGLTDLGRAAVRALCAERVLIDLAHMSERALEDSFALLDELDPQREIPVVASHTGYRFGRQEYNLSEATIRRVADRGGVIGLIFAEHQLLDGLGRAPKSLEDSVAVLAQHIDRIHELTGSHRHTAIGSDLDGFIKPTLAGLQTMTDMRPLEAALTARYGRADAALICSENVLGLLRSHWGRA
jgi:microsomal dipeptidase-like Zn-dependent dipeptidase